MNALHKQLLRVRMVEEEIARRYPDKTIRVPVHLSLGQEAIAVGVCAALGASDKIFSTHRCHAHFLAAGGDLKAMAAELYGRPEGCNGGRGGSMHLHGGSLIASMPIVGSSIPVACGAALASKLSGDGGIAVVFFGDAAVEEGVFHESLNIASVLNLPILFVCENNEYSINTHLNKRQPDRLITQIAKASNVTAYNYPNCDVDGVAAVAGPMVSAVRELSRPVLVCFETYRYAEHCGVNERHDALNFKLSSDPLFGIEISETDRAEIQAEIAGAFNG